MIKRIVRLVLLAMAARAAWRWLGSKADEELETVRGAKQDVNGSRWDEGPEETARLDRIAPKYGTHRLEGESNQSLGERLHDIVTTEHARYKRALDQWDGESPLPKAPFS